MGTNVIENELEISHRPLVSVVMALSKWDQYCDQAISSILNQNYSFFEFLIVANGSSTAEIVTKLKIYNDVRIKVLSTDLGGLSNALNYGISIARGKYIARMDGDDVSYPKRLIRQVDFLEENPSCYMVSSRPHLIDCNGVVLPDRMVAFKGSILPNIFLPVINSFCHPLVTFRRDKFIDIGGYKYGFHSEDHELFLRMKSFSKKCEFATVLSEELGAYRRHGNQLTTQNLYRTSLDVSIFLLRYFLLTGNILCLIGLIWNFPLIVVFKRLTRKVLRRCH